MKYCVEHNEPRNAVEPNGPSKVKADQTTAPLLDTNNSEEISNKVGEKEQLAGVPKWHNLHEGQEARS